MELEHFQGRVRKNRTEYEKNKGTNESFGQSLEDSWLWFKTKSALATTSDLRDSTINVDVANGVITLKGTVTTAAEKSKAKQVADGIEGKKSVVDQLKVAPNDSMTNTGKRNSNSHVEYNTRNNPATFLLLKGGLRLAFSFWARTAFDGGDDLSGCDT